MSFRIDRCGDDKKTKQKKPRFFKDICVNKNNFIGYHKRCGNNKTF